MEVTTEALSNPKKAKKAVNRVVQALETRKSQLQTLTDERNRQEERIKDAYGDWLYGIRMLKATIDQLKRQPELPEMGRLVEAAKTNLVFGRKMDQELVYKLKLEHGEDELADFIEWFDIIGHKRHVEKDECPWMLHSIAEGSGGENGSSKSASSKKIGRRALGKEVERLKSEYEKLLLEKEYAWNEYKGMEDNLITQLKEKNAKVTELLETVEQLHSSSLEKDAEIADLKARLAKMGDEASMKDGEASRVLKELNSLKKSNGEINTDGQRRYPPPNSRFSTAEPKAKALASDYNHWSKRTTRTLKRKQSSQELPDHNHWSKRTTRTLKRKQSSSQEPTKLFSADFKIPKLKISVLR